MMKTQKAFTYRGSKPSVIEATILYQLDFYEHGLMSAETKRLFFAFSSLFMYDSGSVALNTLQLMQESRMSSLKP